MAESVGAPHAMLAIEMSQREASVALSVAGDSGDAVVRARSFAAGARERDPLLPAIDELVREAGIDPRSIGLVIVSAGPGGFTGLRIAVTTAKAISFASGAAIVALPSALVAAASAVGDEVGVDRVAVLSAIKREGEVSTGWHSVATRGADGWIEECPGTLIRLDPDPEAVLVGGEENAPTPPRVLLADRFLPDETRERLLDAGVVIREPCFDATVALELGRAARARGESVAASALLPIYPREPEAVRLWRERSA